ERDLVDALVLGERLAGFDTEAVDHIEHAGRQDVADEIHEYHDRHGRLLGGLQHHAIACGKRRRKLPCRHEDWEIPRDDLPDHAERLMIVVGDGLVVDLAQRALLRADAGGEIAEMIDRERDVGEARLPDRLAVIDGLDRGKHVQIFLDAVGDFVQDLIALGRRHLAPGVLGLMRGVKRKLDVSGLGARDLAYRLAGDRADIVEILAIDRRHPLAADEIVVTRAHGDARIQGLDDLVQHGGSSRKYVYLLYWP